MKTTQKRRPTLLVGLLLLSLLVLAIGVPVAQAMLVSGSGGGSAPVTTAGTGTEVGRGGVGLEAASFTQDSWSATVTTPAAGTEGRGGVGLASASGPQVPSAATPATSGTSATTYWLIGAAVAVLIAGIGAWALLRRRRQPAESASAAYCARHPGDSLCGAA